MTLTFCHAFLKVWASYPSRTNSGTSNLGTRKKFIRSAFSEVYLWKMRGGTTDVNAFFLSTAAKVLAVEIIGFYQTVLGV
jgi:hypothetical protein